ncbi:unnamed protein product [Phytophthora fragariaefolia]|uniref:Unnamed protein product n=1 Tax=Phytophthora fragariaefolia TaxID=1490495 RepID=A0A9W7CUC8_9STRA|nr:unnamed protein product [Phytophthora fragariaefolia]
MVTRSLRSFDHHHYNKFGSDVSILLITKRLLELSALAICRDVWAGIDTDKNMALGSGVGYNANSGAAGTFGSSVGSSAVRDGNSKRADAVVATEGVLHVVVDVFAGIDPDSKVGFDAGGVCDGNAYGVVAGRSGAIEFSATNSKSSDTMVVNAGLLHVIAGGFAGTATVTFGERYLTAGPGKYVLLL